MDNFRLPAGARGATRRFTTPHRRGASRRLVPYDHGQGQGQGQVGGLVLASVEVLVLALVVAVLLPVLVVVGAEALVIAMVSV